jgi:SAM-dependent methyltransferase
MAEEQLSGILWMAKKPKGYLEGKTVVEIGPGCCCALEVSGARTKIAVEPLAQQYKDNKLLLDGDYGVTYLNQGSERIPLFDNYADVVIASNCLDHVENLEKSVKEIFRILKKGGELFLNLEIDHAPTECEPFALSMEDVKDTFKAFKTVFINTTKDKKDGRVWLRAVYKKP